jgi:capsular exopolysaccharide synthesis family protein
MSDESEGLIGRAALLLRQPGPARSLRDPEFVPPREFFFPQPPSAFRACLTALRHHWLPASAVALVVMACVVVVAFVLTPQYKATALVMIEPRRTDVVKIDPVLSHLPADTDTVASEVVVVRSHDLLRRLVRELHLDAHPEFDPNLVPSWERSAREAVDWMGSWLPSSAAAGLAALFTRKPLTGESRIEAVVAAVEHHIDVVVTQGSYVIGITFVSTDRLLPNLVVNTLADIYIKNQSEMKEAASRQANRWIIGDLSKLRERATAAAQRVADFRVAHGLIEGQELTLVRQQISELEKASTAAKVERTTLAAKLGTMTTPASSSLVLSSPTIQELRRQQAVLRVENAHLGSVFGDANPHLRSKQAQIADISRNIANETGKIVAGLRADYNAAVNHENALALRLEALKGEYARAELAQVTLKHLEDEEHADRILYTNYLERSKETGDTDFQIPDAVLVSYAAAPLAPFFPNKTMIISLGFLLSALSSFLAAAALEKLDRSFRSEAQMERVLGLPVLGTVPEFPRRPDDGDLDMLSLTGSVMTDIYMRLRSGASQCILVASALPGEGKTTVALLLARVAAMNGKGVLFIDADLRRSGLGNWPGARRGLSELLSGTAVLGEAIVRTHYSGIDTITCGGPVANPSGALASGAMRELISKARRDYDLVIIDSPAIMAGPDAVILSSLADQTLLFARWARTPRTIVSIALRRLQEGGARMIAAVLLRTNLKQIGRYSMTDGLSYTKTIRNYYPLPK